MPYGTAFAVASIGRFGFSAANAGNGACSAYPPQALDMTGRNLLIMHDDLAGCTSAPRSSCRPISPSPNGLTSSASRRSHDASLFDRLERDDFRFVHIRHERSSLSILVA